MNDQPVFLEEERQLILMALAQLAVRRPGWTRALADIAAKLEGVALFEQFKVLALFAPPEPTP